MTNVTMIGTGNVGQAIAGLVIPGTGGPLASGTVGGLTTTVLIAGDDTDAKTLLADVVTAAGLNAIDAGSLRRARELEATGFPQISLAVGEKVSWIGGFGVAA